MAHEVTIEEVKAYMEANSFQGIHHDIETIQNLDGANVGSFRTWTLQDIKSGSEAEKNEIVRAYSNALAGKPNFYFVHRF